MITLAETDQDITQCFAVMAELRPHLVAAEFLDLIRTQQAEGYKLACLKTHEDGVVALAGYRIAHNLFMGKHLYVDDLVAAEKCRSKGYGEALIQWLQSTAQQAQCQVLHLDSGTHRSGAHKFYFKHGFRIASYHFSQPVKE